MLLSNSADKRFGGDSCHEIRDELSGLSLPGGGMQLPTLPVRAAASNFFPRYRDDVSAVNGQSLSKN